MQCYWLRGWWVVERIATPTLAPGKTVINELGVGGTMPAANIPSKAQTAGFRFILR